MLPLLTLGAGAEKYFIKLAANLREQGILADAVTLDEKFYKKFARWLHIFFSFNFFGTIDISGKESEETIDKNLGRANWIKSPYKKLRYILNRYDVIYTKNEIVDLALLKLIGYKNLPPIIVGVHTPIIYPRAKSFSAKLHNFLYQSFLYQWLLSGSVCLHVSNEFTKRFVEQKFNFPARLIYYPFDADEFVSSGQASGIEFDKGKINICFLARLSEQKGLGELREIIKKISNSSEVRSKINLNIFARGDKNTEAEFKKYDRRYKWLNYFGHVENKLIAAILKEQDLLISPAKWETMPYNILEAQALGVPVVAFNVAGVSDIVLNGKTGFLVENEQEFWQEIVAFIKNNRFSKREIAAYVKKKFKIGRAHV